MVSKKDRSRKPTGSVNADYVENPGATPRSKVIDQQLALIYRTHGEIQEDTLLGYASDEKHPLHGYFEWEDSVAAQKYRMAQARNMILASRYLVRIQEDARRSEVKATLVRRFLPAGKARTFQMRTDVLSEDELRANFIANKIASLQSWCNSVVDVRELDGVRSSIEGILGSWDQ